MDNNSTDSVVVHYCASTWSYNTCGASALQWMSVITIISMTNHVMATARKYLLGTKNRDTVRELKWCRDLAERAFIRTGIRSLWCVNMVNNLKEKEKEKKKTVDLININNVFGNRLLKVFQKATNLKNLLQHRNDAHVFFTLKYAKLFYTLDDVFNVNSRFQVSEKTTIQCHLLVTGTSSPHVRHITVCTTWSNSDRKLWSSVMFIVWK